MISHYKKEYIPGILWLSGHVGYPQNLLSSYS